MTKACVPVRPSAARNIAPWVRADLWTRPFDAHLAQISLPSLAGLADGVAIERTPFSRRLARWIGWSETAPPSVRSAVAEIGRYVFFGPDATRWMARRFCMADGRLPLRRWASLFFSSPLDLC